ncbi:hypothetical protein EJ03DRAFT_374884 [Teratosphaeria nubilosa]|uniref:Uncharacterized protein n=1 Tax=Teratosphaeria nubilosa TaxID=161662 RepID=A0A6G1L9F8_9PEZI|nr:hypothetical protein EJ03DRAFT_374884 [Teratosphaeria nubilosa]
MYMGQFILPKMPAERKTTSNRVHGPEPTLEDDLKGAGSRRGVPTRGERSKFPPRYDNLSNCAIFGDNRGFSELCASVLEQLIVSAEIQLMQRGFQSTSVPYTNLPPTSKLFLSFWVEEAAGWWTAECHRNPKLDDLPASFSREVTKAMAFVRREQEKDES